MAVTIPSEFDPKTANALPNLGGDFDVADAVRRTKDFAEIDQQQSVFRQQSGEAAKTGEITSSVGAASAVIHRDTVAKQKENDARDTAHLQMILAAQRLGTFEKGLEAKYGDNFASNMFADLYEDGLIEEDDYKRIMSIEDKDERRKAIAAHIQDGLDNGTLTMADLKDHDWAKDWLDLHEDVRTTEVLKAEAIANGQSNVMDNKNDLGAVQKAETITADENTMKTAEIFEKQEDYALEEKSTGFSLNLPGMSG